MPKKKYGVILVVLLGIIAVAAGTIHAASGIPNQAGDNELTEEAKHDGPLGVQATVTVTPTKGYGEWTPDVVLQMNGDAVAKKLPAKHQLIVDGWNREIDQPRLVYMPEKDRLLLVINHSNPYKQYPRDCRMMFSSDRGDTWSAPVPAEGGAGAVAYLGKGKLILGVSFSEDYGATWKSRPIPLAANGGPYYQWAPYLVDRDSKGKVIRLVAEGYNEGKPGVAGEFPKGYCHSYFRFSYDGGLTWPEEIEPPSLNGGGGEPQVAVSEKALCRAANGTIIAACRIKHQEHKGKLDHYSGLGVSLSRDNGKTWSKIKILYDYGRMHPSMVTMPNGSIVLVYDVRLGWLDKDKRLLDADGQPQWSVEAIVSRDNGETWDTKHRYVLAQWSGQYHVQDTSTVLLPDGSLLTAFGAGYRAEPGRTYDGSTVVPAGDPIFNGFPASGPLDVALVRWKP